MGWGWGFKFTAEGLLKCSFVIPFWIYYLTPFQTKRDHIRALGKGWWLSLGFGVRASRSKARLQFPVGDG